MADTVRAEAARSSRGEWWDRTVGSLTARQVNLLLALATIGAIATGLVSWMVGTGWSRWWNALHATCGVLVVVLAPAKTSRSVRTGLRRRRPTRWVSIAFGIVVMATVALGFAHSTGIWIDVGFWSPLWTHVVLAFAATPLLAWHLLARPVRPKAVDLNRRLVIGGGVAVGVAAVAVAAVEAATRLLRLPGADRRFTGSHEVGSFEPDEMPTVSWIDDRAPDDTAAERWGLVIGGAEFAVADLAARSTPLTAALDCTGGWWANQRWDVVTISELLKTDAASFRVTASTGYSRVFPMRDADRVFVAIGYDGRPLRRGHGAPARIVAPGRRGPWWVKWVVSIEPTDRPWWLQLPFPPT